MRWTPVIYRGKIYRKYWASSEGDVLSVRRKKLLVPFRSTRGNLQVTLPGKQPMLSRLIAESFNPGFEGTIMWADGNRNNNALDNLLLFPRN
jgi:hypothetical protein